MPGTTSAFDYELLGADGSTWVGFMLAKPRDNQDRIVPGAPITIAGGLTASDGDLPITKRLTPSNQESFVRGYGLDYAAAEGVYTRTDGYALPTGAATDVTLPALHMSATPIVAFEEYGNALWCGQAGDGATANTSRVLVSSDGTGAGAGLFAESKTFVATDLVRDMLVFDDGAGTPVLWVSTSDVSRGNGRMHKWDGAAWTSTAVGTFGTAGRNKLAKVWWVTKDGIGGWRMIAGSSSKGYIAYTKPNSDPLLAASWVDGVKLGTGYELLALAAARRHVYGGARDGLFDLDELGNSPNLTSYLDKFPHPNNGVTAIYHDNYVYLSVAQGIDRVYVGDNEALQENPGQCGPGWGTQVENDWANIYFTDFATDQGYLVAAGYSPQKGRAGIWWGKDRQILGIDSANPLIWYGPECVSATNVFVSKMRFSSPAATPESLRLWLASHVGGANPGLTWVSIPIAGSPLQNLTASGAHRFATGTTGASSIWNTYSRLTLLPETYGDTVSNKIIYQHGIATRGLDVPTTTQLTLETRADPAPGSITWTTSDAITASPSQDVSPSTVVSGHRIERRINFFSPSGGATPAKVAVLDAVRTMAWKIVPAFGTWTPDIEYGVGVVTLDNAADDRDADFVTDQLIALTLTRTTMRDRYDRRYTVKMEQVLSRVETLHDSGKSVAAHVEINILAGPL
jgi:hypothetical protein